MKVAIKFCGGCDPTYDRVEIFRQIQSLAGDSIEWLTMEDQAYEAVLLICGCLSACLEDELQYISRLVSVRHKDLSPECVLAQLLGKGQSDANQDQG